MSAAASRAPYCVPYRRTALQAVHIASLLRLFRAGGIAALPTDTVYGLCCLPTDTAAVRHIVRLKRRSVYKGFVLIAASLAVCAPYIAPLSRRCVARIAAAHEPTTWLLPAGGRAFLPLTGGRDTIAVRITTHPLCAALSKYLHAPLVATSANPSGLPPARTARAVRRYFPHTAVIDGGTATHAPSKIMTLDGTTIR